MQMDLVVSAGRSQQHADRAERANLLTREARHSSVPFIDFEIFQPLGINDADRIARLIDRRLQALQALLLGGVEKGLPARVRFCPDYPHPERAGFVTGLRCPCPDFKCLRHGRAARADRRTPVASHSGSAPSSQRASNLCPTSSLAPPNDANNACAGLFAYATRPYRTINKASLDSSAKSSGFMSCTAPTWLPV